MMCDNDIKEELSYAYVHAVASHAGFAFDRPSKDRDSVDCEVKGHGKIASDSRMYSPRLELQVKATAMNSPSAATFPFPLNLKNYDDLRAERYVPILLIVYVMPIGKMDWLSHTENGLTCRQCAYWCNLKGLSASSNSTKQVVHIPTANHFSSETLTAIMHKVSRLEDIGHAI